MSIFATLIDLFKSKEGEPETIREAEREALRQAWGLEPNDPVLEPEPKPAEANDPTGKTYDQQIWEKKLIRSVTDQKEICNKNFMVHIGELINESHNLGLAPDVIFRTAQEAFRSAVRHVVADREITRAEHIYLDELKESLGLPNEIATEISRSVVAEAEAIFKSVIKGA